MCRPAGFVFTFFTTSYAVTYNCTSVSYLISKSTSESHLLPLQLLLHLVPTTNKWILSILEFTVSILEFTYSVKKYFTAEKHGACIKLGCLCSINWCYMTRDHREKKRAVVLIFCLKARNPSWTYKHSRWWGGAYQCLILACHLFWNSMLVDWQQTVSYCSPTVH